MSGPRGKWADYRVSDGCPSRYLEKAGRGPFARLRPAVRAEEQVPDRKERGEVLVAMLGLSRMVDSVVLRTGEERRQRVPSGSRRLAWKKMDQYASSEPTIVAGTGVTWISAAHRDCNGEYAHRLFEPVVSQIGQAVQTAVGMMQLVLLQ